MITLTENAAKHVQSYIAKRGKPWPPIVFDDLLRALKE